MRRRRIPPCRLRRNPPALGQSPRSSKTCPRWFAPGRATGPDDRRDAELVRCWYCPENFERKGRAQQYAADRGVLTTNVALAWLLGLPLNVFPLIGPRTPRELTTCLQALTLQLSPPQVRWLEVGDR